MQTLTETSRVGVFHFSPALTFFAGAGAGTFLSFPTFASTRPAFGYAGRATFGLYPRGLFSTILLINLF